MKKANKLDYFVYIVECRDKSYYTGITNALPRRLEKHNKGIGSKYTRSRRPVKLVWSQNSLTRSDALKLEYKIKQLSKKEKADLVSKTNEILI